MSGVGTQAPASWGESVAQRLLDVAGCPVCGGALDGGCCAHCGSDLRGPIGVEVWNSSLAAASAVRAREEVLRRVPVVSAPSHARIAAPTAGAVPTASPAASSSPAGPRPASIPPSPPASSGRNAVEGDPQGSATLQSVLATAGAALFAVAAIVFTYFNPDLADRALRSVIVGLVTVVFLGGAWMLSRRGLRFSAEAVGGLGLVFGALDIHAIAQLAAPGIDPWPTAAVATVAAGAVMLRAGGRRGIRIWQWTGALALALVPAMLGTAGGTGLTGALGAIGVAAAGTAIVEAIPVPKVERITLTVVQLGAAVVALMLVWRVEAFDGVQYLLTVSALLALVALHAVVAARRLLSRVWAFGVGAVGSVAVIVAAYAGMTAWPAGSSWVFAIVPAAAALALVLVGAVVPLPRAVPRGVVAGGAPAVLAGPTLLVLAPAAMTGVATVGDFLRGGSGGSVLGMPGWSVPFGLLALAAGLAGFSALARRRDGIRPLALATARISLCLAVVAVLVVGCGPLLPLPWAVVVLAVSVVAVAALLRTGALGVSAAGVRVILVISAHLALACAVMISWRDAETVPLSGVGILLALGALAAATSVRWRFLHVGAGFAYGLVLLATALENAGAEQAGLGAIARLSLTASAGLLVAIAATYTPRIGARAWQAVLVVSAVPFGIGVLQVVVERSGWTALSTGLMSVLALTLVLTRRPGLTTAVRTLAAGLLVPTVAVVIVCLGAQLLSSSGSPVVLPLIAVLVALVLPSTALIRTALARRGLPLASADAARLAIEGSALVTGAIATGLALAREAAGLGTTFLVLLILGLGAVAAAVFASRRYAWGVAGAAFTGALWCVWGLAGVQLLEAYLLPPTLGAAAVAVALTLRGGRATGLYAAGLLIAIAPLLAVVAVSRSGDAGAGVGAWRVTGLLAGAWMLLALEAVVRRHAGPRMRRLRVLRLPTLLGAGLAALAGTVQGVRWGLGLDAPSLSGAGLLLACVGISALGAAALLVAGEGARGAVPEASRLRTSRWLAAPAALALAAGSWCAIERDWFSIWAMWSLMLGYLVLMAVTAARQRRGPTALPPVWVLFAIAFATAIVAWSPRDLRVEWFSLPLGAMLLLAGAIGMRGATDAGAVTTRTRGTLDSWPGRWSGSWALLAPGLVTMMIASIVSTFTDPLTWRAILVMVLALAALLVGSRGRLAAPFLIGLVVLPIENVFVFSVQIGRGIESMPWWITLAVMGAVLLIIAVTAERRTGEAGSVAARIRDLR